VTTLPLPESFALTIRGYDRDQVDERLAELHEELHLLTLDRDAAQSQAELLAGRLAQARTEITALRGQLDRLCQTPADPAAVGTRVSRLLALARSEADDLVLTAHQRAAALRAEAEDAVRRTQVQLRAIDEVLADAESVLNERTAFPVTAAA
jgi:cell division septum initiation protein DivIVA